MFEVVDMGCFGQIIEEIEADPLFEAVRIKNRCVANSSAPRVV